MKRSDMQIYIIKLCTRREIVAATTHGSVAANRPNEALAILIAIDIILELSQRRNVHNSNKQMALRCGSEQTLSRDDNVTISGILPECASHKASIVSIYLKSK